MKNRRMIVSIVAGIIGGLAIVGLIYWMMTSSNGPSFSWFQNYDADNDQPYGTKFVKEMLEDYKPGEFTFNEKKPIHELLQDKDMDATYVLIGQSMFMDVYDAEVMLAFIRAGNDVFIATQEPPTSLTARVFDEECDRGISYDDVELITASANFFNDKLASPHGYDYAARFRADEIPSQWQYLDNGVICESVESMMPLGYIDGERVNFMKFNVGDGHLFLHSNPLMFTNLFMTREEKLEYAEKVFSHTAGDNIIWDEFSKIPFFGKNDAYNSPLYFIMQQPSLKYAWWIFLVSVILYVVFAAKRTQRVIPVLERKTNTSLEFLTMISSLHFENGNHLDMARKKMKYFLYFIRARYGINTQSLTEEQVRRLAEKSKVSVADVQHIADRYEVIDRYATSNVEENRLVDLFNAIDKFYKTCK